jgi:hypothetical protein
MIGATEPETRGAWLKEKKGKKEEKGRTSIGNASWCRVY